MFIALSVCMLTSCLDKYPQDEIPANRAITTIDEANQAVIGIYNAWLSGALYSCSQLRFGLPSLDGAIPDSPLYI